MVPQVDREMFVKALREMGHEPNDYAGQRISLASMCELYDLDDAAVMDAIEERLLAAHYDYKLDTIWIDAIEAAHFYFCVRNEAHLYSANNV